MTTITISYDVSEDKFQLIEDLLADEETNNVNFNGENFSAERGEFTSIDSDDAEYIVLLGKINLIIDGY